MGKSAPMLTVKELEAKLLKTIVEGTEKHINKARIAVGGCAGACLDIFFNWDTDNVPHIRKVWTIRTDLKDGKDIQLTKQTYLYKGV
jgi:hypothetical protein